MNGATERIADARPRRFRRYPEYKNSGIEWLGDIPVHWEVSPLRYTCRSIETGGTPPIHYLDFVEKSRVDWFTPGDFGRDLVLRDSARKLTQEAVFLGKARLFPAGSVFVVGIGTLGKVGLIEKSASANQQVNVMIPRDDCDSYFLAHALSILGDVMTTIANSTTLPIINQQQMGALHVPMPPVFEQRQIAAFLLKETAKIDGLVAGKERLIELLQEKRTALITRAVTQGLDANVPMKDSGVEWLGEIPVHWRTERLKYLATLNDEALAESTDPNFEMVYVDIGSIDAAAGITGTEEIVFEKAPSRARRIVRSGDVIVSTVRTYLRAIAAIEAPESNLIVSTGFAVIRPRQLESSFASYALRAPHFVERVVANSVGVSYPAINASSLACFAIAYPKVDEQRVIAAFLVRETARIDALIAKIRQAIDHLKEFRTALISAAVTGKIDVREEAS